MKLRQKIRRSITWKLVAVTLGLSVVPLMILCVFLARYFYNTNFERAVQNSTSILSSTSATIDEKIRKLNMTSTLAVTDKTVRSLMEEDARAADRRTMTDTERYVLIREFFYSLEILNSDICGSTLITNREIYGNYTGGQVYNPEFERLYRSTPWYQQSINLRGSPVLTGAHVPYQTVESSLEVVSMARSIFAAGTQQYLGTILIDVDTAHLTAILKQASWHKRDFIVLLDEENQPICFGEGREMEDRILELQLGEEGSLRFTDGEGVRYLFNYITSGYTGWKLGHVIPERIVIEESGRATLLIVQAMVAVILCVIAGAWFVLRSVARPIVILNRRIDRIGAGDLSDYDDGLSGRVDELGQLARSIRRLKDSLNELIHRLANAINKQKDAQLKALQCQINPHFILNTLTSIQMNAKLNRNEEVVRMIGHLGSLFKNYIRMDKMLVSLREEADCIRVYMELQQMRYGEKLGYIETLPEGIMGYYCLKFIVQPIVENAVAHGMEAKKERTVVRVSGMLAENGHLCIFVEDDGIGISEERLLELQAKLANSNRTAIDTEKSIGLQNVHNRLRLYYGDDYGVRVESVEDQGTRVTITMPAITSPEGQIP